MCFVSLQCPAPSLQELKHQSKLPSGDDSRKGLMQWAHEGFPGAADDETTSGMEA